MFPKRSSALLYFCLLLLLMPALPSPSGTAEAREYYIEALDIDAEVHQDGRVSFTETRRVRFDGSYSWLEQRFRKQGFTDIENIEVRLNGRSLRFNPEGRDDAVPGEYSIRETDKSIFVRTHLAAEDESVELVLRYELKGALSVNGDWAEFYWSFLANGWGRSTADISIRLNFTDAPEDAWDQLYAWQESRAVAPQLNVEDHRWHFTAERIRKERSIRIRSIFPSAWINNAALIPTDAELNPQAIQAQIEAERQAAEEARERKEARAAFLVPLSFALAVFALVFACFMLYKYRFQHPKGGGATQQVPPMTDRPPSDLSPALVGKLIGMNYSSSQYRLLSTIFDMGRKGYFTFTQEPESDKNKKPEFQLSRTGKPPADELHSWEYSALKLVENRLEGETKSFKELFEDKSELSFSFTKDSNSAEEKDLAHWLAKWEKALDEEAKACDWWVDNEKPMAVLVIIELVLLVLGLFLMIYLDDVASVVPGLTLMVASLAGLIMAFGLHMRTPEGDAQYKKWMAYRKGLKEQRVSADKQFKGKHIIYAIVLGVSGKQFENLISSLSIGSEDLSWMIFMPGVYPNAAMFSSGISQAVSASATSISTSTSISSGSTGAVGGAAGGGGGGGAG